jgi:D-glycero-D-manno-heptose 1,7-bisphosphate phosphatase
MADKAVFFDRDNTLIEDPGYINHPDQVKLLDGVPEALIELRAMGYKLIVVSNQSAIARGIVTEKTLAQIHDRLRQLLAEKDAYLDKIYYCPYLVDGVIEKYRRESDLRKPNPGMLLTAAREMNLDLAQSWMVGDSPHDIDAGFRAGCKTILLDSPAHLKQLPPGSSVPDFKAVNMKEAVNIIKKQLRSPPKPFEDTPSPLQAPPAEPPHDPLPVQQPPIAPAAQTAPPTTEQLLSAILEHLKSMQRAGLFAESDFSMTRLFAGAAQIIALFCLLISIWFLMSPNRQTDHILIALGFAMVLQVMSLTLYIMQGPR